jgi:hypothetical protein
MLQRNFDIIQDTRVDTNSKKIQICSTPRVCVTQSTGSRLFHGDNSLLSINLIIINYIYFHVSTENNIRPIVYSELSSSFGFESFFSGTQTMSTTSRVWLSNIS